MTDPNQPELFPTTTSSHQDIRANHFPLRDNEEARKMRETSGDSCLRLSKENTRLGVFSRMFMVTLPWVSTKCYTTWKVKATPHKRLLYQLVALMHPTSVIDSGLWATPNTMDHLPPRSEEATKKLQEGHRKGRTKPSNLREQVDEKTMALWPTPRARDYKDSINVVPPSVQNGTRSPTLGQKVAETRMFPTPTTQEIEHPNMKLTKTGRRLSKDGKSSHSLNLADTVKMWPTPNAWDGNRGPRSEKNLQEKNHMVNLITAVQTDQRKNEQEVGGTLNPMWVEWLMGYPLGWTDLED